MYPIQIDDEFAHIDEDGDLWEAFATFGKHRSIAVVHESPFTGYPLGEAIARLARTANIKGSPPRPEIIADVLEPNISRAAGNIGEKQGAALIDTCSDAIDAQLAKVSRSENQSV